MWTFQTTEDPSLFQTVWQWHNALPRRLKQACGFHDRDDFLNSMTERGEKYVGFNDGRFAAMVYGEPTHNNTVEGHLYCPRGSDIDFLAAMVTFAKKEALKKFQRVIVEIPPHHRTLHGLVLRAGFFDTGLFKMPGSQFYVAMR